MNGNFCWNIQWTYYYHTFMNNLFSGLGHGTIAAFIGCDIHNNRSWSHASHHLLDVLAHVDERQRAHVPSRELRRDRPTDAARGPRDDRHLPRNVHRRPLGLLHCDIVALPPAPVTGNRRPGGAVARR